jgi:hypothetical protein
VNAASACLRSETLREAWLTKVRISLARNMLLNCSALLRESQNTSRFSPRCRRAITVAAFSSDATWSMVTSASVLTDGTADHCYGSRLGANQASNSVGLLTVADRPIRCSGRFQVLVQPMQHRAQMPSSVIRRECMQFVDDHGLQVAKPCWPIDPGRDQHRLD